MTAVPTAPTIRTPRTGSRTPGEGRRAALLLSPTFLVLALVILYPLISAFHQSLYSSESGLDAQGFVIEGDVFVGLGNYLEIFAGAESGRFYNALGNTTFFTFTSVALETVIGVAFAVAMNRAFRGRAFLRAAVLVPWAIPTAVSGLLWRWIFQADGIANALSGQQVLWTAEGFASQVAVITAEVWKTAPFIGLLVLAGMQIIPEEVYEAAKLDGAGAWRQFRSITLPLVKPALLVAVLFRLLDALRMFDLPFVLIGPRKSSVETLSILAWDSSNQLQYGAASAFSIVLLVYVAVIAFVFVKLLGADVAGAGEQRRLRRAAAKRGGVR
ncbi:multiple sugar transport system permease protein [Diaminobutyricimonas aerilata]|uniref:Multiple sugar transport system permease protein n=1 Tax=Diaminobutyricimonas aerilata TaxID=1162967 RepID=A0A2M9CIC1_9MICO|nr:sugar ABC transporter permease [Diaminobutyricimonas aerilata]PJJ71637.1 multiple sugar transport system permease protein [Diaminobutyricimonas aerilata]